MTTSNGDVVVVGGGIAGIATADFLGRAGVKTTVVERDSAGSHASGFAYGGLNPVFETSRCPVPGKNRWTMNSPGRKTPTLQLFSQGAIKSLR